MIFILATGCVRRAIDGYPGTFVQKQKTQGAFNVVTDDEHVRTLQAKLKLEPSDVATHMELAGIFESYRLFDDAFTQYSEAFRLSPSEEAVLGLARSAQGAGRSSQAIPTLEAFVKQSPAVNTWDQLGLLYDGAGNFAAEENALRQ